MQIILSFGWNLIVSLFDLLFMSFVEFKYWKIIANYKIAADTIKLDKTSDEIEADRKEASGNMSNVQFGIAYLTLLLVTLGLTLDGYITWSCMGYSILFTMILHYTGNEDLWYFLKNFILNVIPDWWWEERKDKIYNIGKHKLPKECPWLYESRVIFGLTIPPYIIRLFGGKQVSFKGLVASSFFGWFIILIIYFQLWSYFF